MPAGHNCEDPQRIEQDALQWLDDLQDRNADVELAVLNPTGQSIPAALEEANFHFWMLPPIQLQHVRHRGLEKLWRRPHAKDAALTSAKRSTARAKRLLLHEQEPAAGKHLGAAGGEGDAPSNAIEQLDAQMTL
jgi:hypothetical protein